MNQNIVNFSTFKKPKKRNALGSYLESHNLIFFKKIFQLKKIVDLLAFFDKPKSKVLVIVYYFSMCWIAAYIFIELNTNILATCVQGICANRIEYVRIESRRSKVKDRIEDIEIKRSKLFDRKRNDRNPKHRKHKRSNSQLSNVKRSNRKDRKLKDRNPKYRKSWRKD
jgi:hypothetical protein